MVSSNLSRAKKYTKELNLPKDKDASMNLIPADFFIDEDFKIVKAHHGSHLDDHVPVAASFHQPLSLAFCLLIVPLARFFQHVPIAPLLGWVKCSKQSAAFPI